MMMAWSVYHLSIIMQERRTPPCLCEEMLPNYKHHLNAQIIDRLSHHQHSIDLAWQLVNTPPAWFQTAQARGPVAYIPAASIMQNMYFLPFPHDESHYPRFLKRSTSLVVKVYPMRLTSFALTYTNKDSNIDRYDLVYLSC